MKLLEKKSPELYFVVLLSWLGIFLIFGDFLVESLVVAHFWAKSQPFWNGILIIFSANLIMLFMAYFWLNGLKDIIYTLYFWKSSKSAMHPFYGISKKFISKHTNKISKPSVDFIYTTCNDFDEESLLESMKQDYDKDLMRFFILDDSTDPKYQARIDKFANQHNLEIIRRQQKKWFKAGNINNWLHIVADPAPYFVILDSDEILPHNFVQKSLEYFVFEDVSIVQANHLASRNYTGFTSLFARGVESHWAAYQSVKNFAGFMSFLGHGALIKREDIMSAGGFPSVVAEDLALSIHLARNGKRIVYAPDIYCQEVYPVDYFAFKKRHAKWTMGNMEFIKKFSHLFLSPKLTWFEKLDILLFVYNLPLTIIFISLLIIHLFVYPLVGFEPYYHPILLIPTILTLFAPILNDLIFFSSKMRISKLLLYLIYIVLLYGSMYFVSFLSAVKAFFGQAVFLVTPKSQNHVSILESLWNNKGEILFGIILIVIASLSGQIGSILLIAVPSILSISLGLLSYEKKHQNYEPVIDYKHDGVSVSERQKIFASIIFIVFMFVAVASGLMASFWQNEGEVLGVSEKIYQKYE